MKGREKEEKKEKRKILWVFLSYSGFTSPCGAVRAVLNVFNVLCYHIVVLRGGIFRTEDVVVVVHSTRKRSTRACDWEKKHKSV